MIKTDFPTTKMVIVNIDNDSFFKRPSAGMTVPDLERFIDQYAESAVTHLFLCPNGQRTSYRSKVHDAIWDPLFEGGYSDNIWAKNCRILFEAGIDPYSVWIRRCREKGISPWLTVRMNDCHFADNLNYFRSSRFWRSHPELWRIPHLKECEIWSDRALNYAHSEVREFQMALIRELLERYDVDGIELDWMRFEEHLTPGKEVEEAHFLTEFTEKTRKEICLTEKRLGHRIQLGCRVPASPEQCRAKGYAVDQWVKEKLVDMVIPSCFYASDEPDFSKAEWHDFLGADVPVIPSTEDGTAFYSGGPRLNKWAIDYRGFFDRMYQRGFDSFYLFNFPYSLLRSQEMRLDCLSAISEVTPEAVAMAPRRYRPGFRDDVDGRISQHSQFPLALTDGAELNIDLGSGKSLFPVLTLGVKESLSECRGTVELGGKSFPARFAVQQCELEGQTHLEVILAPEVLKPGLNRVIFRGFPQACTVQGAELITE